MRSTEWLRVGLASALLTTFVIATNSSAQTFSEWTAPVNVGSPVNTSANEV